MTSVFSLFLCLKCWTFWVGNPCQYRKLLLLYSVWINKNLDSKSWILGSVNPIEDNNQSRWQIFLVLKLKMGNLQVLEQRLKLLDNLGKTPFSWRILSENKTPMFHCLGYCNFWLINPCVSPMLSYEVMSSAVHQVLNNQRSSPCEKSQKVCYVWEVQKVKVRNTEAAVNITLS